jgi:hypothetical protein
METSIIATNGVATIPNFVANVLSIKREVKEKHRPQYLYLPIVKAPEWIYVSQWPKETECCCISGNKLYFNRIYSKYRLVSFLQKKLEKVFPIEKKYILEFVI